MIKDNEVFTLTDQQKHAVERATDYLECKNGKRYFSIGGYAGTGKTTVLKSIIERNPGAIPCAFTGKAALRMRQKDVDGASTIHSLIYKYDKKQNKFWKRDVVEGSYFLVDEASMIPKKLWDDLLFYCKPIVLVGDLGQLEPVGDDPRLMERPDVVLDKIHRQAEGSGIISLASDIRLGNDVKDFYANTVFEKRVSDTDILMHDIIICGFNKSRLKYNRMKREELDMIDESCLIDEGEEIIILVNNHKLGVFNGQILTVTKIVEDKKDVAIVEVTDGDCEEFRLPLYKAQFNTIKNLARDGKWVKSQYGKKYWKPAIKNQNEYAFADYGYAITCHKSQGSEWNDVLVLDEQCDIWCDKRWRYTAITRAAKSLTIVGMEI
jgi:exodeoxyribonuclease-5